MAKKKEESAQVPSEPVEELEEKDNKDRTVMTVVAVKRGYYGDRMRYPAGEGPPKVSGVPFKIYRYQFSDYRKKKGNGVRGWMKEVSGKQAVIPKKPKDPVPWKQGKGPDVPPSEKPGPVDVAPPGTPDGDQEQI